MRNLGVLFLLILFGGTVILGAMLNDPYWEQFGINGNGFEVAFVITLFLMVVTTIPTVMVTKPMPGLYHAEETPEQREATIKMMREIQNRKD